MVQVDEMGIRELQDGVVVAEIPRADILSATLISGRRSERPFAQAFLGLLLSGVGAVCLAVVLEGALSKAFAYGAVNLPLGLFVLWTTFRFGPVVLVRTPRETRRLFPAGDQLKTLEAALARYSAHLG